MDVALEKGTIEQGDVQALKAWREDPSTYGV